MILQQIFNQESSPIALLMERFQKAAVLNCSELPEVIVLSLPHELILITNSIYNL